MARKTRIICKNKFLNQEEEEIRKAYTQKWIEMICFLEKNKEYDK